MSILFGKTRNSSPNVTLKSYETPESIALEYVEETTTIENALYVADIMLESTMYGEDNLEEVAENALSNAWNKFVAAAKKFYAKIKAWIMDMIKKLKDYFMGAKKFVLKYKDEIKKKDVKGYVFSSKLNPNNIGQIKKLEKDDSMIDVIEEMSDEFDVRADGSLVPKEKVEVSLAKIDKIKDEVESAGKMLFTDDSRQYNMSPAYVSSMLSLVEDSNDIVESYNSVLDAIKDAESKFNDSASDLKEEDASAKATAIRSAQSNVQKAINKSISAVEKTRGLIQKAVSAASKILKSFAMKKTAKESYTSDVFEAALELL